MPRPTLAARTLLSAVALGAFATPVLHAQATAASTVEAQANSSFDFTIANMMRGPEVYGRAPENVRWSPDSRYIYFRWLPPGTDWRENPVDYRVRAVRGAQPESLSRAHMDSIGPLLSNGEPSPDRRRKVSAYEGDLWLIEGMRARRLTQTMEAERSPSWDARGERVFFLRGDNAFALDVATGFVQQLTNVRSGPEPRTPQADVHDKALQRQQRELFQSVRDDIRRDSIMEANRARRDSQQVRPLHLRQGERLTQVSVSPSGNALLLIASAQPQGAKQTMVPNFVTESGYTEPLNVRTKVGDAQGVSRVALMQLPSGTVKWLNVVPGDTSRVAGMSRFGGWTANGDRALIFTATADFKTRFLHSVTSDGTLRTVDTLNDSAWVAGPCFGCMGWTSDGARAWYVSEASGYAHLYTANPDGSDTRQLTQGDWEVLSVELSENGREFRMETSEGSPFNRHYYRMPVAGGNRTRITSGDGSHQVELSPDGRLLANVHSTANKPPELFLMENRTGAQMSQLTTSPTADFLSFPWIVPEIVMVPASDGVQVPARIYRPEDMGAQPNGAGVIFVHGAGYLHNVHNWWSQYSREYMFNHYLASKGYVVLDIDYRASAGYGRDWRTAIYRYMGGRDLQDHVDGSKYLTKEFGINPESIGLYGGSYGGFITLMALFTEPEYFGAGAALRSVTDWAHYNHGYTGRILNLPQDDSLSYHRSSPIFFAEGLEDPLLIAHGMVDTNVHFQDVVRLSQRLIELGKTGWEMAVYPVEDHGFVRPSSWTDEYRRIFELFERHLPERP
ncbi:MAG TPA: prolyl oligopeptidase family serine peptidase [Gemmatimonadales bacterium]|nr:prolyl oligopeptidase family serine peptidase [Gemmatimonadales bacterium]